MATYVISDIHGRMGAFHRMLRQIRFSAQDILYVLGDVVDRGPHGIRLLQELMVAPNIRMLLGNHELMLLDYYRAGAGQTEISRWNRNRNGETKEGFRRLSQREKEDLLLFLETRPDFVEITVGSQVYHLVHGWPGNNRHDCVWGRPESDSVSSPLPKKRIIIGHTPVPLVLHHSDAALDRYFEGLQARKGHVEILHAPGFIDIDCGCGHSAPGCCLGCLRLDDMMHFYEPMEPEAECQETAPKI